MKEFSESRKGRTELVQHVCEFLNHLISDEKLVFGARQLLEQALVMTWSAFEVLARDVFEEVLNLNPSKLMDLRRHPAVRKGSRFFATLN